MFERQPVFITFNQLVKMPEAHIGALVSRKGKESNQMATAFWREKVWRIWAYVSGRTKRIGKEVAYGSIRQLP